MWRTKVRFTYIRKINCMKKKVVLNIRTKQSLFSRELYEKKEEILAKKNEEFSRSKAHIITQASLKPINNQRC